MTRRAQAPVKKAKSANDGPAPVAHRVSPADRIRRHVDELFSQDRPLPEILEQVARMGAQLLMQAALEAEVTEFPGRDRYQRAALARKARPGSRNGYREVTVKTTAGRLPCPDLSCAAPPRRSRPACSVPT